MISSNIKELIKGSSVIRAMFEEGKKLSQQFGSENVYDFSLGNPWVEPPVEIKESILEILEHELPNKIHGYMNNSGFEDAREIIAKRLSIDSGVTFGSEHIVMTVGASGALNVLLKTLLDPGDEVVVFAPFFGEYKNYVSNFGGNLIIIPPDMSSFMLNIAELEHKISFSTKALIINSPNNPSGAVYSAEIIKELTELLEKKQKEYGHSIYLISDEPYRKIVFEGGDPPYITNFYNNSFIAYSYSKALSLPGERIGYLAVSPTIDDIEDVLSGLNVANRILGFVNAPSLFQLAVARCETAAVDVSVYQKNRDMLFKSLTDFGFSCVKPQGAFYMFPRSLEENDAAFCAKAKEFRLLLVPGSAFACPGFFRLAFCVDPDMAERSLEAFEKLAQTYK